MFIQGDQWSNFETDSVTQIPFRKFRLCGIWTTPKAGGQPLSASYENADASGTMLLLCREIKIAQLVLKDPNISQKLNQWHVCIQWEQNCFNDFPVFLGRPLSNMTLYKATTGKPTYTDLMGRETKWPELDISSAVGPKETMALIVSSTSTACLSVCLSIRSRDQQVSLKVVESIAARRYRLCDLLSNSYPFPRVSTHPLLWGRLHIEFWT